MESILQRCASATQVATKAKDAITDVAAFLEWASNESLVDELLAVRTPLESAEEMMAEADVPADLRNAKSVVAELVNSFGNTAMELYAETVVDAAPCTADAVQARKNVIEGRPLFLGLWKLMRSYDTDAKAGCVTSNIIFYIIFKFKLFKLIYIYNLYYLELSYYYYYDSDYSFTLILVLIIFFRLTLFLFIF